MRYIIVLFSFLFLPSVVVLAQQGEDISYKRDTSTTIGVDTLLPAIQYDMIGTFIDGKVILRWAPKNDFSFASANGLQYQLERFDVEGAFVDTTSRKVVDVAPWEADAFLPFLDQDEPYILAAGQVLYGDTEATDSGPANFGKRSLEVKNKHSIALLAADIDARASEALGWRYEDADVLPEREYFYRLWSKDSILIATNAFTIIETVERPLPTPEFEEVTGRENGIDLYWSHAKHGSFYTSYHVEASKDSINWNRINANPIIRSYSKDYQSDLISYAHDVANYEGHYYRLVAVTPYGQQSEPSSQIYAEARDMTPPQQAINVYIETDPIAKTATTSWELPDDSEIDKVRLYRSYGFDDVAEPISAPFSPTTMEYTDTISDQLQFHYYQIATIDTAGNEIRTLPQLAAFRDTLPPDAPTGLTGTIDSNGVVTISWNRNSEPDLLGYSIYFSNQGNHMFNNLSNQPQRDTFYIDTLQLNTTTENIFYKVVAADFHYNVSDFGETIKLKKPDVIPPLAPRFRSIKQKNGTVYLDMITSKAKDAFEQKLYRRRKADTTYQYVTDIVQGVITDETVEEGGTYVYQAIVVDDDGLSASSEVQVNVRDNRRPVPPTVTATFDKDQKLTTLEWDADDQVEEYLIYRSVNDGPLMVLKRLTGEVSQFMDRRTVPNTTYAYQVKVKWANGMLSPLSTPVSVITQAQNSSNE